MDSPPFDQLTFEFFSGLIKTKFRVRLDGEGSVELQLAEISPVQMASAGGANGPKVENFSLFFLGPLQPVLSQKIYLFESDTHGGFELFIVPIGRDAAVVRYEAVFSRLVK